MSNSAQVAASILALLEFQTADESDNFRKVAVGLAAISQVVAVTLFTLSRHRKEDVDEARFITDMLERHNTQIRSVFERLKDATKPTGSLETNDLNPNR